MVIADRVREQVSGFGGGTIAVPLPGVAVSGFQTFLSGWGASGTGWYAIAIGAQWETGYGTLNAGGTVLTRTAPYNGSSGAATLVNFSAGTLECFGTIPASRIKLTTVTRYLSGSGTHTTALGCTRMRVTALGGGGGGTGSATQAASNGGTGGTGGTTTFGTALLTAAGGTGSIFGGTGGAATINSPALDVGSATGGNGSGFAVIGNVSTSQTAGGAGGASAFGGNGGGSGGSAGTAGAINTGGGGGGAGCTPGSGAMVSGGGGGAGACVRAIIPAPAATYNYAVGAAGAAGIAGTSGAAGGAGGSGIIIVEEEFA